MKAVSLDSTLFYSPPKNRNGYWSKRFKDARKELLTVFAINRSSVHVVSVWASKVGGNEKQWVAGKSQMLDNGLGPWRSRFIYNLNMQLLNKNHISVSALSSKMNKRLLRH